MTPEEAIELLKTTNRVDEDGNGFGRILLPSERDGIIQLLIDLSQENAELKAKLENAIVPKFKIGQEVWSMSKCIEGNPDTLPNEWLDEDCNPQVRPLTIKAYRLGVVFEGYKYYEGLDSEDELFATREEAEASLKDKDND